AAPAAPAAPSPAARRRGQAGTTAYAATTGSANMVASRVAFNPTGVVSRYAASTPAADSSAPVRRAGRRTRTATARLVSVAWIMSERLMFIQPPAPNPAAITAIGTAAATATTAPPTTTRPAPARRRVPRAGRAALSTSAVPASPRNSPATGLAAAVSTASAAASTYPNRRARPESPGPGWAAGGGGASSSSAQSPSATPTANVTRPETRLPAKPTAPSTPPSSGRVAPVRRNRPTSAHADTTTAAAPTGRGP